MNLETETITLRKKELWNLLNLHHFQGRSIEANFRHSSTSSNFYVPLRIESCSESRIRCTWAETKGIPEDYRSLTCEYVQLFDAQRPVRFEIGELVFSPEGISFELPEIGSVINFRKVARIPVKTVAAEILQHGIQYRGWLEDFSTVGFRVRLITSENPTLNWLNETAPCLVLLRNREEVIYSATCSISYPRMQISGQILLLSPTESSIRRFRPKQFRSPRQKLTPSPVARLRHPISERDLYLPVYDLSSTGVSLEEAQLTSLLLPGMLIPELSIEIGNHSLLRCKAQVLYRMVVPENQKVVRCGLAFLDLGLEDQAGLSALIHPMIEPHTFVCNQVVPEELWKFFFETGFLYAEKYESIQREKEDFKRTMEKLYTQSPSIARHFVYQEHGTLSAHMSMLRFYARSWLIQHHAASKAGHPLSGIIVLKQVGSYVNEFHTHPSTKMDYVICYFRPDNKFPLRVFGGVAQKIDDPKRSSLDAFAYFYLPKEKQVEECVYQLFPAQDKDLEAFAKEYHRKSGGLLVNALDLLPGASTDLALNREYEALGFHRERYIFSLYQKSTLQALFMLVRSNTGLNLSKLTNCIHAFILNPAQLEPNILFSALKSIEQNFSGDRMPVLVYPKKYMEDWNLPYDKTYNLWVLSMRATDEYFQALESIFKRPMHG